MAKYEMGDQTVKLFDKILDSDYNELLNEQQMQELSELYRFEKGVIDRIGHLGYKGSSDDIDSIWSF